MLATVTVRRRPAPAHGRVLPSAPPAPPLPAREVWEAYRANPTTRTRNLILEAYLPLLRHIAKRLHKRLPRLVDVDDLVSEGAFGLMDAVDKFDPSKPNTFSTFCSKRVFGAIIDHLRSMDPTPRLMREREALVERLVDGFRKQFGRPPCDEEILQRLGLDAEAGLRILRDGVAVRVTSLSRERRGRPGEPGTRLEETICDRRQPSTLSGVALKDAKAHIIRRLSRAEKLVLVLYRAEELKMHEIGRVLGLSESRVSQMLGLIEAKVRSYIRSRGLDVA
jgi:RNA polymerase sigma factor FliA